MPCRPAGSDGLLELVTICSGCGAAVPTSALFCAGCGRQARQQRPAPPVAPLALIGTVGGAQEVRTVGPSALPGRPGPPPSAPVASRRRPPLIGLLPAIFLGAVAARGWRAPDRAWGHLSATAALVVGMTAILALILWAVLLGVGVGVGAGSRWRETPAPPAPLIPVPSIPVSSIPVRSIPAVSSSAGVITAVPGLPVEVGAPPGWLDRTGVAPHRRSDPGPGPQSTNPDGGFGAVRAPAVALPAAEWVLMLDDGRVIKLDRPAVFGRDPAALPGEEGIQLRAVADETRTVSKTHVKLEPGSDSVLVTDRHSTNGVVIVTAGVATRCRAGEPMVATPGSVVRFGDREMQVRRP